jgi:Hypothetical protein (DUF2513)
MLDPNGRALMTRDMELIRRIVFVIQAKKDARPESIQIPDYDGAMVARHLEMMVDAGLIEGQTVDGTDMPFPIVAVKDLSWSGHDFASALANENVWGSIKKAFSPADIAAMPLGVLKDLGLSLLTQWAKGKLGLPS